MATKGKEFHALEWKVRIMAETLSEAGKISSPSRREFARFADIDYDTLKAAWRSGRLSNELEAKLALAAEFDPSDLSWIDENVLPSQRSAAGPSYPGRDTVAAFRSMLRRRHGFTGTGIFVRVVNDRPQLLDSNLATFSVEDSGQGAIAGEPAPLFFSIVVEPGFDPKGIHYGFQRVRLRLVLDPATTTRIVDRLAQDKKVEIKNAVLEVRGGEHFPEWFLHVQGTVLDGEYSSRNEPLCVLTGASIGEELRADIAVRPMDGTLVAVDGAPLPDLLKRRIVEILCAKKLPGSTDTQGWISLGLQRLRIMRADRT